MSKSQILNVPLGLIVPSADNPRRDFGDIAALAERISATGGLPVNPIVVVADGDVYRIVDGERRWRALKTLHADGFEVPVVSFGDPCEAHEAVAMLATDDKLRLTDAESVRGFQTALTLGVDEQSVARAVNRSVGDVRKARSVVDQAGEQTSIDQLVAAAEFEGDDRKAVLGAAPGKWEATAERIRQRLREEAEVAELAAAIDALVRDGRAERFEERPKSDWFFVFTVGTAAELESTVARKGDEELAVCPAAYHDGWWTVLRKFEDPGQEPETEEEREARELSERRDSAFRSLKNSLARFAATHAGAPHLQEVAGRLRRTEGYSYAGDILRRQLLDIGCDALVVDDLLCCRASMYEVALQMLRSGNAWWEWTLAYLHPAIDDGYEPSDEDFWLLAQAADECDAQAEKEEDGE